MPPTPPAPGLAEATASYRMPAGPKLVALAVLVGGLLLLALLQGGWPPPPAAVAVVGAGAVWWGLKVLRSEVTVGPGWLSSQGLLGRRWVRTDQLVRTRVGRSGVDRIVVLTDRDGRKAGVLLGMLSQEHAVRVQLAQDVRRSVDAGLVLGDDVAELLGARLRRR